MLGIARRRRSSLALFFGTLLGAEFFPPSDEGRIFVMMETPPGTSLEGTLDRVKQAEKWMLAQPELKGLFAGVGVSGPEGPGNVTNAVFVAILKPRSERERSAQELMTAARAALGKIPGVDVRVFDLSSMIGGGGRGELEFAMRGNLEIDELDRLSDEFMRRLRAPAGFVDLSKILKRRAARGARDPRPREVRRARRRRAHASRRSCRPASAGSTSRSSRKAATATTCACGSRRRSAPTPRRSARCTCAPSDGGVVELRNIARIETGAAPSTISRDQRQRSVTISANLEGAPRRRRDRRRDADRRRRSCPRA